MPVPALRSLLVPLLFALGVTTAPADTWILANGDRLTGRLIAETGAGIEIEHPQLGRLVLTRAQLRGDIQESPAPAARATAAKPPAPASPAVRAGKRIQWKRQVDFGYTMQEGAKTREELNARAQVEARKGSDSFRGTARVLRAKSQGTLTLDRVEADLRWRHDFSKRLFAQAQTVYASDDVRRIDLSLEQQLGGGYRLLDGERHVVNVGLGAVVQHLAREGYDDTTALLGSFFQDYSLALNSRLKLAQEATVFVADSAGLAARGGRTALATAPSDASYRVKFNTALQGRMSDHVSLTLRYEYDYDGSLPNPDLREDSRLTTSVGYSW